MFSYKGKSYTAVVSFLGDAVNIYVPDESLHGIIPNGKARVDLGQSIIGEGVKPGAQQSLLQSIMAGIELEMSETEKREGRK